ncbi:MAG: hypothetical protein HZA68_13055 [Rhodovulum sp.]|nr:hypothetical protein [Rhodovulum sp.]
MTPTVDLLLRLTDQAEALLYRSAVRIDDAQLVALREDVLRASNKPVEDERLITEFAVLLAHVLMLLDRERRYHRDQRAAGLAQVAGVLLPLVQRDLWRAIEVAKLPPPRAD